MTEKLKLNSVTGISPAQIVALAISLAAVLALAACSSGPSAKFTASTEGGNVPLEVTFDASENSSSATFLWEFGDGQTSSDRQPTHTYEDAGEFTVRLTVIRGDSEVTSSQVVRMFPGQAGWVDVDPAAISLESGETVQLTASAFDFLGNPVPNANIEWNVNPDAGQLNEDGVFTAGPNIGEFPDAVTASFERQDVTGEGNLAATIIFGELESVLIQPPEIDLRVNERIDLKVIARDKQGHVFPETDVEWFPLRTFDSVQPGGEFVAGSAPTEEPQDLIRVLVTAGGDTKVATVSGTVSPGILDRVAVLASPPIVAVGSPASLSAVGFDRFGNQLELDSVSWGLVSDEYGEITSEGVYTPSGDAPSVSGPIISVEGGVDNITQVAEVSMRVLPGPAVAMEINQDGDSIAVGAGNPFTVTITDEWGNEITGANVLWSVNDGGDITFDGIFVAGFERGEFLTAVTATLPVGAAGNVDEITATADLFIRDRSSDMIAIEVSNSTDSSILLIDFIDGDIRPLSDELNNDGGVEVSPAWWPDGQRLAFSSDVSGTMQIYDIDIETEEVRQLVDVPDGSFMPSFSPDGQQIAFVVLAEDGWQIYVAGVPVLDEGEDFVPITLENATKISADDSIQSLLPWWSPDGSTIAFTTSRSPSDVDIRIAPSDGSSEPVILGREGLSAFGWSEDGEKVLAIDVQQQTENTLLVVDAITGEIDGFIPLPFNAFLASWSPDNSEAAVVDRGTGSLWLLDADGSTLRVAVNSNFVPRRTAWRPVPVDADEVLAEQADDDTEGTATPLSG